MGTFGFRQWLRVGRRIKTADGCTRTTTVGHGSGRSRGDGRRITTAGGIRVRGVGLGGLVRLVPLTTGGRRWLGSSGGVAVSGLDLGSGSDMQTLVGSLWRLTSIITLGMVRVMWGLAAQIS